MTHPSRLLVVGGSIAGLLSAAALAPRFDEVLIIERDELPGEPTPRRCVPQDRQIHQLLPYGLERIEELVPGFTADLLGHGCDEYDLSRDLAFRTSAGWNVRAPGDIRAVGFMRPKFEWLLRRRVLGLANVLVQRATVTGLVLHPAEQNRVAGVNVQASAGGSDELTGTFVIDATGRATRFGKWLATCGYDSPSEQHVNSLIGYSTMIVRLNDGDIPSGARGIAAPPSPLSSRGGAIQPCGDGNHVVVAAGTGGDHPPADVDSFIDFLAGATTPLLSKIVAGAEVVSGPETYRFAGTKRRLWEDAGLKRPEGLVSVGDAVCSLNPLYGQGMTMAAVGARILKQLAEDPEAVREAGFAQKYFETLSVSVDYAFNMVAQQDSLFPAVQCVNYEPPSPSAAEAAARDAVAAAATEDIDVMTAVLRAAFCMDPTGLASAPVQQAVGTWLEQQRSPRPAAVDAVDIPRVEATAATPLPKVLH